MVLAESSLRYVSRRDDEPLRERLREAAREKPRWGYRRLQIVLDRTGAHVNHKRIYRVYREAGLTIRRKARKRLRREGSPRPAFTGPNQEWALDFVHDAAASGRKFRALSVVDPYTRECLALEVDSSMGSRRVTRELKQSSPSVERRKRFVGTTGRSLPRVIFWPGAWSGRSSWCTSSRASRCRTRTWKVFTGNCGTNV